MPKIVSRRLAPPAPFRPSRSARNATTRPSAEVRQAMLEALDEGFGNPSSDHARGQHARDAVHKARTRVACLVGADPTGVVFTSSATEANATILRSAIEQSTDRSSIITTPVEHSSVLRTCDFFAGRGASVGYVPVDAAGVIDLEALGRMLATAPVALVSIQWANNETGVVQPFQLCRDEQHGRGSEGGTFDRRGLRPSAPLQGAAPAGKAGSGGWLMRFGGHETFAVREGWLHKGLRLLADEPHLLVDEHAADWLGVGRNMAKSIRHWLLATGLAQLTATKPKASFEMTPLGQLIWQNDRYFVEPGTWWALHVLFPIAATVSRAESKHGCQRQRPPGAE